MNRLQGLKVKHDGYLRVHASELKLRGTAEKADQAHDFARAQHAERRADRVGGRAETLRQRLRATRRGLGAFEKRNGISLETRSRFVRRFGLQLNRSAAPAPQ
jgi:hypothetical protein